MREVRDQPFRPVLADQRDAVAGLQPDPLQRRGKRRDLPRRLAPADRAPRAFALGPEERRVALLRGAGQEKRDEIVEPFELTRHAVPLPRRRFLAETIASATRRWLGAAMMPCFRKFARALAVRQPRRLRAAQRRRAERNAQRVSASRSSSPPIRSRPRPGLNVLKRGGSAVDAAIAIQAMLSLVEPQSSGVGGGAFMTYFDGATGKITVYDGREVAPAQAASDHVPRPVGQAAAVQHRGGQRPRDRRSRRREDARPRARRAWQAAVEQPVRRRRAHRRPRLHRLARGSSG